MRIVRTLTCALVILGLMVPVVGLSATQIFSWDFIKPGDGTPPANALAKNVERFHAKYPDIRLKVEVVPPPSIDPELIHPPLLV
ncbi:MAG: hypothetical protein HYT85_15830 [candidate division NC10 bacterium]|nr:hypothetical protein [candidate division NC10 bacterium]MBI2116535.1 hypothetical protein [candidate division NC10 bacterium]MBI2456027.1 hypothetical protein [candidate division NC10 bacterium]MBI2561648.1 hypothetical protein [candidate division NC10 bacterium]